MTAALPSEAGEAKTAQPFCKVNLPLDQSSRKHNERLAEGSFGQMVQRLKGTPWLEVLFQDPCP